MNNDKLERIAKALYGILVAIIGILTKQFKIDSEDLLYIVRRVYDIFETDRIGKTKRGRRITGMKNIIKYHDKIDNLDCKDARDIIIKCIFNDLKDKKNTSAKAFEIMSKEYSMPQETIRAIVYGKGKKQSNTRND